MSSFPCIICNRDLTRVMPDAEGQPNDGLMCITYGNYGSTVFDPEDLSYLAFNICDDCMVEKAKSGHVMITRDRRYVYVEDFPGSVGYERVDRPYLPWVPEIDYKDEEPIFHVDELDNYLDMEKRYKLFFMVPKDEIRKYVAEQSDDE